MIDAPASRRAPRRPAPTGGAHYVYIVRCADGTLYTGYARDPVRRTAAHNRGRGAKYTAGRRPVTLEYSEPFGSLSAALRRERELKRWARARKEQLITRRASRESA